MHVGRGIGQKRENAKKDDQGKKEKQERLAPQQGRTPDPTKFPTDAVWRGDVLVASMGTFFFFVGGFCCQVCERKKKDF